MRGFWNRFVGYFGRNQCEADSKNNSSLAWTSLSKFPRPCTVVTFDSPKPKAKPCGREICSVKRFSVVHRRLAVDWYFFQIPIAIWQQLRGSVPADSSWTFRDAPTPPGRKTLSATEYSSLSSNIILYVPYHYSELNQYCYC